MTFVRKHGRWWLPLLLALGLMLAGRAERPFSAPGWLFELR